MSSIIPIKRVLATSGNLGVYGVAGGVDISTCSNCTDVETGQLLVPPGSPVFWNMDDGKTVAIADIPKVRRMAGGVAIDTDGDGIANYIQKVAFNYFRPCDVEEINYDTPICGTAPKADFLFDCVEAGKTYSILVKWINNDTENRQANNWHDEYTIVFRVVPGTCTPCSDSTLNPKAAVCEIINITKGKQRSQLHRFFGRSVGLSHKDLPFDIVGLEAKSYSYCFSPIPADCSDCKTVSRIKSIRIGTDPDDVLTVFTNANVPGDVTETYDAQLDGIVCQINTLLGQKAATLNRSQTCCSIKLEINTCKDIVLYDDTDTIIPVCSPTVNPLDPVAYANSCGVCYDNGSTKTFTAGIRVIGKPTQAKCGTQFSGPNIGYLGMELSIEPVSGWEDAQTYTRVVTKGTLPRNLGYQLQWDQFYMEPDTHMGDAVRARFYPSKNVGRNEQVTVVCKKSYCTMNMTMAHKFSDQSTHSMINGPKSVTVWAVPKDDLVTMLSLQLYLQAIGAASGCPTKPNGYCIVDGNPDVMTDDATAIGPHGGLIV